MDYRYLTESKNEFNNFLCGILVPHLYHGIKGMLKYSGNVYNQIELKNKAGAKINNPGIINIFKKTLDGLSGLNNHEIEEEYLRIKNASGCADWFDNLVRASFKSYVLFLTWDPKNSNSKYSDNSIYESIVIKDFIHKCYVISCNYFRDNPEIFISKNSKKEIFEILKMCIDMSIKKSLPYNQIIQEYLQIEFDKTNDVNSREIQNIKSMVYDIMNDKKYGSIPNINNLIVDTGNDEFVNLEDSEYKRIQLENFINQEKINEQNKLDNGKKLDEIDNSDKSFKSYKSSKSYTSKKGIDSETSNDDDNLSSNKLNQNGGKNSQSTSSQESNNISTNNLSSNNISTNNITTNPESNQVNQTNFEKSSNQVITTDNNDITSTIMSRAEIKNKEIEEIMNDSTITKNKNNSGKNKLKKMSNNKKYSETSEQNTSGQNVSESNNNKSELTDLIRSKTSIQNIITSPPMIRTKPKDKLNDLIGGGEIIINKKDNLGAKKNIRVSKNKNNILSEKFDQAESFYDNMIKI